MADSLKSSLQSGEGSQKIAERKEQLKSRPGEVAGNVRERLDQMNIGRNYEEGRITRQLERQTARIPSGSYLSMAIGSMLISAGLATFARKKEFANFVGLWAPSFLLIGIYNKLVKLEEQSRLGFTEGHHEAA